MRKITFLSIISIWLITASFGQEAKPNFASCELKEFVDFVATTTGKTILYDNTLPNRKVFLSNFKYNSNDELFTTFLSVIEYHGYILENVGEKDRELVKIKRNIQGPWTQTPTLSSPQELEKVRHQDMFVTMVVPLKYASAREIQTSLRALRIINPQGGNLAGLESANAVLITDYAPNVKRVYDVIQQLDRLSPSEEAILTSDKTTFKLEGENISLIAPKNMEIMAVLNVKQNASLTITNAQKYDPKKIDSTPGADTDNSAAITNTNVLVSLDPNSPKLELWLTPYVVKSIPIHFELQALSTGKTRCEITVYAISKDNPKGLTLELWGLGIDRPLPSGKVIRFSLCFQAPE